jgi:hypothetical protein
MTYIESEIMVSGWNSCVAEVAWITAAISPIWLDWWGPGILIALLRESLGANHIPLLQHVLSLPLL